MTTTVYSNTVTSFSHNGNNFVVKDGEVELPENAVAAALSHGFQRTPIIAPVKPDPLADKVAAMNRQELVQYCTDVKIPMGNGRPKLEDLKTLVYKSMKEDEVVE